MPTGDSQPAEPQGFSVRTLRAATVYFAAVFGVGFMLGLVRLPVLVPLLGERSAELIEAPLMLATIVLVGRWIAHRFLAGAARSEHLVVGALALALMLAAELTVVISMRGTTVTEYVHNRDVVAGIVYVTLLGTFALAPLANRRSS